MKLYGRSDNANSPHSKNKEFQDGYAKGIESLSYDGLKVLKAEENLRLDVGDDMDNGFDEFKRGFWASRSQYAAMGMRKRRKEL